ncbi:POTRA domain-containing protein [Nitrospirillum sp. BR 11164]|uniref:ShlB/FhaC/HecB family hemolysin secretion/activation protein n=1 Tax=Nitrospirillum sp. BR 11164 TaxID=3104324 RepID=UPI002AFE95FE|nr:POTRA domain-containing protein [Nitrospirillum sp. BR 11164]MEA1648680.1 POTRA domain-containing protein [Nitrospirillum sp. BR 11164]
MTETAQPLLSPHARTAHKRADSGRGRRALRAAALTTAALFITLPAMAQQAQPPRLPSGAEPGREAPRPVMPTPGAPGAAITVPKATAAQAPQGAEQYSFALKGVVIEGATAFPAAELAAFYAGLVGKTVTVADMFKVANDIEVRYRDAGYITSRVVVPEQTIEDGRFRIQVIEGFVADIRFDDDIGPARAAVARLLEPLRGVTPISVGEIERRLLLADDLPGLTVRASLEPSPTILGASIIVVKSERKAVDASLAFDNRNTPYVGAFEWVGSVSVNSFGEHADRLTLTSKVSTPFRREWFVQGGYQGMFSSDGLTAGLTSSFSRASPGQELDQLNVHSRVASEMGTVTYPIIRSRLENLRAFGEFEYRDIRTTLGADLFNQDHLRIFRAGVSYDKTDTWDGITAVRGTVHQGLDILDATPRKSDYASRLGGNADFTKFTVDVTRVQQLPANFSLLATATAQMSLAPLLASEEMALGGPNFGRAYDEGEISGDNGWAGSLELRYTPLVPELFPEGMQFYAVFDGGRVWSLSNYRPTGRVTVASVGGGVRINMAKELFTTLEVDQPLDRQVQTQGGKPTRVFFSITAHY